MLCHFHENALQCNWSCDTRAVTLVEKATMTIGVHHIVNGLIVFTYLAQISRMKAEKCFATRDE